MTTQAAPARQRSTTGVLGLPQVLRLAGFALATYLAGDIGRLTFDEQLQISLVWPLYGVAVLWLASGTPRTWPWDVAGLVAATAASVLLNDGTAAQAVLGAVLALVAAGAWVAVMRALAPDLWGAGGARPMGTLRDLAVFLAASAVAAGVAALGRGTGLGLVPVSSPEDIWLTAIRNLSWILGIGALGMLVLPRRDLSPARWWSRAGRDEHLPLRVLETLAVVAATVGLATAAFGSDPTPFSFSLVLCTVWAAFRLPSVGALAFALVLGAVGVLATLQGIGVFAGATDPFTGAAIAQGFLITQVVAALAISFATEERRAAVARAGAAEREADSRAALFSAVIEHLAEGVSVITADETYAVRNPAVRRMTGAGGFLRPSLGGADQPVMVSSDGEPLAVADMPHARARNGESVIRELVRIRTADGTERFLEVTSIPVHGLDGDPRPVVVNTLRDVTTEQEERDQLVAFAGVVAHDLKNPLTVVRGWTESLREELEAAEEPDVATLRSMLSRVQGASDQMHHFIDDLLDFAVARDRPLHVVELDLSALGEEVAELRREGGTRPRISVQPGMIVRGDRALLRQLLDNLVGNAVKYVAPGVRPSVAVTASEVDGTLEVSVTDNGVGIPAGMRRKVFDSFARAHAPDYTGTGLGLAICERVVSRHGGRIWVDEEQVDGTRIRFTLPVR
ncbi:ATP-binding protein [Nocardioides euryhalodurans]|uniref:Sensor-like histidine kinase SenX3 n=1 Tax=Nocardioides euryhalodurans TaxID=2518370 RepID=A0A4P7GIF1_9ACTN|nr:ATP-binding protein [Nocardioides euryhalodurans]QBR91686.1 PAS domain S-box protein [Nocardioides euryhalodurans]